MLVHAPQSTQKRKCRYSLPKTTQLHAEHKIPIQSGPRTTSVSAKHIRHPMQNGTEIPPGYQGAYHISISATNVDVHKLHQHTVIHVDARTPIDGNAYRHKLHQHTVIDDGARTPIAAQKHATCLPSGTRLPGPPIMCTTGNQNERTERRITDIA